MKKFEKKSAFLNIEASMIAPVPNMMHNISNQENYRIEQVDSDDEKKVKSLCIEKDNGIVLKLNRKKRKLVNTSDGQINYQSSKRKSFNHSHDLDDSVYANLTDLVNKYAAENTRSEHNGSSLISKLATKPAIKSLNQSFNRSFDQSISDSPVLSSKKSSQVSHSTPKVQCRDLNISNYEQIANDFSPFKNESKTIQTAKRNPKKSSLQNIDSFESPTLHKRSKLIQKSNKPKARTLFNSTNRNFYDQSAPNSPSRSPVRSLSQTICTPESPVAPAKIKKPILKPTSSCSKRFSKAASFDTYKTPLKNKNSSNLSKNELSPIESQIISEVQSPHKGKSKVIESRCFLKLSKKLEKQIQLNNLAKMNASKSNTTQPKKTLVNDLLNLVHRKREERGNWLSLNKKDDVQRSSLFLRLTKVRAASNGFVCCDCEIDLTHTNEVVLFRYNQNLKTVIPTHYAKEFELSNRALIEYIGPWCVFDNDKLKTSFILNPFWIHIIDHGAAKAVDEKDAYELIYDNRNLDDTYS